VAGKAGGAVKRSRDKHRRPDEATSRPDKHYDVRLTRKGGAVVATIKPCDVHEAIADSGLRLPDEVMDVVADLIADLAVRDGRRRRRKP
jgi:hypothetical protein